MRFAGHAFVDWDDTIAENIRYFRETEAETSRLIGQLTGAAQTAVAKRGQELDVAVARRMGLVKESLSTAWVECYREFCTHGGLAPDPSAEKELWQLCQRPYTIRQELLPGAGETLRWLHATGFEITIWTAGEEAIQARKIRESGLQSLIHRQVVVPEKSPERLQRAMAERSPDHCFVLGNSAHSDIRPALALGLASYHLAVETWAYDHLEIDESDLNYHRLERIGDLPFALARRFPTAM